MGSTGRLHRCQRVDLLPHAGDTARAVSAGAQHDRTVRSTARRDPVDEVRDHNRGEHRRRIPTVLEFDEVSTIAKTDVDWLLAAGAAPKSSAPVSNRQWHDTDLAGERRHRDRARLERAQVTADLGDPRRCELRHNH